MLGTYLVTIHEFTAEVAVNLMQVHAVVAGQKGLHEFKVPANLVNVPGAAGIVACGLDAAGKSLIAFKADNIVGLPAVEGDLLLFQLGDGFVCVHTKGGIALPGNLVGFQYLCFFHIVVDKIIRLKGQGQTS